MSVTRIICPGGCGFPIAWCACKAMNQCDGCRSKAPLDKNGNHLDQHGRAYMGCQAHLYGYENGRKP